ncbi:phosphatase [uncultured Selenomonas sp.]|uniref:phosphatase n=1 Tax=uncultured Selenomonas sp. TaxID=159275 RepID=UPI0025EF36DB|nr:phosphatase [uncultured Selenomonas sp.]
MKDLLDVHMHTIASGHAYSTVREMITMAKARGLALVGLSEHGPAMEGTCDPIYFCNFKVIKAQDWGIDVVMGVELNVIDYAGSTDLSAQLLARLDYAIASLHDIVIDPGSVEQNTNALIGAMRNPRVNIIGHPDNPHYPVDFDALAKAAKEQHVLLEINNSSYKPNASRPGSWDCGVQLLAACKKYGTEVICGSDAHIDGDVGTHAYSWKLIEACGFPEELVVNTSVERFRSYMDAKK